MMETMTTMNLPRNKPTFLRIKALRLQDDRPAFDIARAARISSGRYSYLERGLLQPTAEERARLAEIFGVPADVLFRPLALRPRETGLVNAS